MHMYTAHRSDRSNSGRHKGSALAIAAEYKRRKQAGELSPREAARATMITKRINESEHKSVNKPAKRRKLEVHKLVYTVQQHIHIHVHIGGVHKAHCCQQCPKLFSLSALLRY